MVESPTARRALPWLHIRIVASFAYLIGTIIWTRQIARAKGYAQNGAVDLVGAIPTNREIIVLWMVGLFLVNLIGRPRREWLTTLLSWAPFLLALFLYDFARSVGYRIHGGADGSPPMIITPQIRADEFFGGGRLPTTILQEHLYNPKTKVIRWYDVIVSAVYTSHFLVPYLFAGFLWSRGKRMWRWYAGIFVSVNFLSCAMFAMATTAPPWWAAKNGYIPPFERTLAGRGWSKIGLNLFSSAINKGAKTVNPYAAIPSLHSAQALLIVICASPFVHKWVRPLLLAYPFWMTFALVYSGEHYLVDVLVGWVVVGLVWAVAWTLKRRFDWVNPFREPRMLLSQPVAIETSAIGVYPTQT